MKKHNAICKEYAAGARRVGFSAKDISGVCAGCGVPLVWGKCRRVELPGECDLFHAIIERVAVKPPPTVPVRPCDFIRGDCRPYISSVPGGWAMARKLCAGCSGACPGAAGCAVMEWHCRRRG